MNRTPNRFENHQEVTDSMYNRATTAIPIVSLLLLFLLLQLQAFAQSKSAADGPSVLLVTAHPDDDALYAATVFKITHLMNGTADLAIMTNGEGGYKYATLGEFIYGEELDSESAGRDKLPGIRKMEVMRGGEIVGIRNYYFLEQIDDEFSLDINNALSSWDVEWIRSRMQEIITTEQYDFIFVMLPTESTHAHHKASAILTLEAVAQIPDAKRPVVLGTTVRGKTLRDGEEPFQFSALEGFPISAPLKDAEPLEFDRTQTFGHDDRLNYQIIGNWVIAEHKSQGTMQLLMGRGEVEQYWFFEMNGSDRYSEAEQLFKEVNAAKVER